MLHIYTCLCNVNNLAEDGRARQPHCTIIILLKFINIYIFGSQEEKKCRLKM